MDKQVMPAAPGLPGSRTSPARERSKPAAALLIRAVSVAFDVSISDLLASVRGRAETALARQMAMYLARVALGMTFEAAGHLFNRDRTTAAYACRRVEDLRDDPIIDDVLSVIETIVRKPALRSDDSGGPQ